MNKDRYRLGVVFKSEIMDSVPGFEGIKDDVTMTPLLRLVVRFLTTNVRNIQEARDMIDGVDDLVYDIYDVRAVSNHLYENEDSREKLVQIVSSLCHMFVDLFSDIGFYEYCNKNKTGRPFVGRGKNHNHYVIYVRKSFYQ